MTAVVWFRNDLRSLDHRALSAACAKHQNVRGLYLLSPKQLDEHIIAPIRRHYLRRALDELGRQLGDLGIVFDIIDLLTPQSTLATIVATTKSTPYTPIASGC